MQEVIVLLIGLAAILIIAKKTIKSLTKPSSPCDGCNGCDLKNEITACSKPHNK